MIIDFRFFLLILIFFSVQPVDSTEKGSFAFRFEGIDHYRETRFQRYMESLGQNNQGEIAVLMIEELKPHARDFLKIEWKLDEKHQETTRVPLVETIPLDELTQASGAASFMGVYFLRIPVPAGELGIEIYGTSSDTRFQVEVLAGRMSAIVHAWDRFGKRALNPRILGALQDQVRLKLYPFESFIEKVAAKPVPPEESKVLVRLTYPESPETEENPPRFLRAWLKNENSEFEAVKIQPRPRGPAHKKCSRVELFFEVPSEQNSTCFDLTLEIMDPRTGRDITHGRDLVCWERPEPRKAMIEYLTLQKSFGPHFRLLSAESLHSPCSYSSSSH